MTLNKLIGTYLVHHGFSASAEAFSRATGQVLRAILNFTPGSQG
jgi:hypothetical protein